MNVIEIEGFNFLEVSQSPNIIISLKGERNFSAEDIKTKKELLKKYFGVLSYQELNQTPVSYTHLTLPTILLV